MAPRKKKVETAPEQRSFEEMLSGAVPEKVEEPTERAMPANVAERICKLVISNPTNTRRGLMLNDGVVILEPGEVREIPENQQVEVRALFKATAMQALLDAGLFRVSGLEDEELVSQKTPEPPAELTDPIQVSDTSMMVGANAEKTYNPASQLKLKDSGTVEV